MASDARGLATPPPVTPEVTGSSPVLLASQAAVVTREIRTAETLARALWAFGCLTGAYLRQPRALEVAGDAVPSMRFSPAPPRVGNYRLETRVTVKQVEVLVFGNVKDSMHVQAVVERVT